MQRFFSALVLLAAASLAQAGVVDVRFADPRGFADAGIGSAEIDRTCKELGDHLVKLGTTMLPPQRSLEIEVLDIDLAGETRLPTARSGRDVRVLRDRADWPRITLRYTLREGGQIVRQDKEHLADMGYMAPDRLMTSTDQEPFHFEKRMLSDWFGQRFAP